MNQNELLQLTEAYCNNNNEDSVRSGALNHILLSMSSKKIEIHSLVLSLGDYLKSRDSILRARGTLLLSEVLCRLPDLPLNQDQLHFLSAFFSDRLQDYSCAAEVIKGLTGLLTNHTLEYPNNQKILRGIFTEVHPSTLPHSHRKMVLQIINIMFDKCLPEIQELKSDFMAGYLQFIDGEKDPRNILYSFQLLPKVIKNIPEYAKFTESLFEILSCYYPISFNPKPNDPNSISKDDLSNALLSCFVCTPLLAQHCIPFLIDKICSNLVETKIESLHTLVYCCKNYGPYAITPYLEDIWSTLRTNILTHKKENVIEESKKTIFQLTRIFTRDETVLNSFLEIIIKECLHHIKSSQDSKISIYCASILFQTVCASPISSKIVLKTILPNLFSFFKDISIAAGGNESGTLKINEQVSIIGLLNDIIKANMISFQQQEKQYDGENPLTPYHDTLYQLLSDSLLNSSSAMRSASIECLSNLYISKKSNDSFNFLLDREKRDTILKVLVSLINSTDDTLRQKSLDSIYNIATNEETTILNGYVVPTLLQMINSVSADNTRELQYYLDAFGKLCSHQLLLDTVIPQIQGLIQHNIKESWSTKEDFEKSKLVLLSISKILDSSTNETSMTICCQSILFPLIKGLFKQIIYIATAINNQQQQQQHLDYFNIICTPCLDTIRSIIQNTSRSSQENAITDVIDVYLNGNLSLLFPDNVQEFKPFASATPLIYKYLIPIFTCIISQSKTDLSSNQSLKQALFDTSLDLNVPDHISIECVKSYASILNKQSPNEITIEYFKSNIIAPILSNESSLPLKLRLIVLLTWCTKALLTNGHPINIELATFISSLISNPDSDISKLACKSFYTLLCDSDILNDKSGSVIKILYQQKFFTLMFSILLNSFKENKDNQMLSSKYLIAISNLLEHVSKDMLLGELDEILPIVMHSLKSFVVTNNNNEDTNESQQSYLLLESSLQTLLMLIKETPTSFTSYLDSLVPSLIKLSVSAPNQKSRKSSLEILYFISVSIPYHNIYPFRGKVIAGIVPALDDKKRLVRRDASKCRNSWYILSK
ncbi:hypothetical protein CYY_006198 [Polysphondylium violaceum]|uniref:MMS19 nucleotide excision repair protein n=1 Tax=Polysphondylium violaceum TaxID=133409 RepID=A0A8J4PSP4_9MYCE|nr:hypothetical protein CYY_006198 [Polysphondylium violaceum]